MNQESFARIQIHDAIRRHKTPDVKAIAAGSGLPVSVVEDLAADVRPPTPDLPVQRGAALLPAAQAPPPGGQVRNSCYVTAIRDVKQPDGATLVLLGCRCGVLLRARLAELPRHWARHTEGLA